MKIAAVETFEIRIPYRRNHTLSSGPLYGAHSVIVRLQTDEGLVGAGEASIPGGPVWSEESVSSARAVIEEYLAPAILGRDPLQCSDVAAVMSKTVRGNPFARAAIEMACFDVAGQALGVPVAQLVGGRRRSSVPMVWSLASGVVEQEIEEARDVNERFGISRFKVKVGHLEAAADIQRVRTLVSNVPEDFQIRLDANQGWNEMTANWALPRLQDLGITVLEQPLPKWDLAGMARLKKQSRVAIMADESAMNANDVLNIIRSASADMIALKLAKAGGILATLQSATVADAAGLSYYMGCMMDTGLGTAAYLQTASALKDMSYGAALPGPLMMSSDILSTEIVYRDGNIEVPAGPGLGVAVDWDAVEHLSNKTR
ncbi:MULTISPECIES: muconate/chloromuconate family cycloisomerase [Paraburkholderia]|uniref:muconate/chloromuconate family cycloisomerase n=1 Tax=Paraburkholderia TaxID=1822464 RepID=UPI000689014C|nr:MULTISPECIES: muconate/chloromuconate family cycloisomerase [Paraburkholderia]MDH6152589.1 muconate/chloromuconate cycloisomerase [Paraburkholderia sp. WSM4179]